MKLKTLIAAAAFSTAAVAANAATFDFAAMGDAYEADFAAFQAWAGSGAYLTQDGITITNITADGTGPADTTKVGYLDGGTMNGLGACSITASAPNSCAGNSDDNISLSLGETVTIAFSTTVSLDDLNLYGDHTLFGDGSITINGASYAVNAGVADLTGLLASSVFTIGLPVNQFGNLAYIGAATVTAVPVPAAGFLLLGGLGGLAAMKRRKKAA